MKAKTKKTVKKTVKKQAVKVIEKPAKIEKAKEVKKVAPPKPEKYILVVGKEKGMLPLERVIKRAVPDGVAIYLRPHPASNESFHPVHTALTRLPASKKSIVDVIFAITATDADTAIYEDLKIPVLDLRTITMKTLKNNIAKMLKG